MRACLDGLTAGNPAIELHALVTGNRIVAVYAGATHRGRFHAMINSFDPAPEIARTSPGDLLMSMMQTIGDRGFSECFVALTAPKVGRQGRAAAQKPSAQRCCVAVGTSL